VVDAGHGGKDPGAVSGGLVEKSSNLRISRAVVKEAKRQGWSVKMSRTGDQFIPLESRPSKANSSKDSVFVSIHSNSTGSAKLGSMTIYRSKSGKRLGRAIMKELAPLTPYKDEGNRADVRGLAVLRVSKRPAVLVEALSVSTPVERRQLKDPEAQRKIAQAIVKGVAEFKGVTYKPVSKPKKAATKPKKASQPELKQVAPKPKPQESPEPETTREEAPETARSAMSPLERWLSTYAGIGPISQLRLLR
jgi:N-acetylmuramoyl-L-alanine amidase